MAKPPLVLSIQSEVVWGHVGQGAARFALQRLGCDVLALPTVLFSNHPGHGALRGSALGADALLDLADGLEAQGLYRQIDGIVSGYFGAPGQIAVARQVVLAVKAANPRAVYLCDPVMGDEGGAYVRPGVAEALARELLPLADIAAPNCFELRSLTARTAKDPGEAAAAARLIGVKEVLITSVPREPGQIGAVLATPGQAWGVFAPKLRQVPFGSGDLLASLYLGRRLLGCAPEAALALAVTSVDSVLRASLGAPEMALIASQDVLVEPGPLLAAEVL